MTTDSANDVNPIWSRDGRWIYFESARSGETQIWKMPATGGEAVQVSRNGGGAPRESPDGKFIYYASGPALWRIPAEGGPATNVLDPLPSFSNLAIVNGGLYLIPPRGRFLSSSIQFLSFSTNKFSNVATLENSRDLVQAGGLSVSQDRRSILYTQIDQASIELMMVENFH